LEGGGESSGSLTAGFMALVTSELTAEEPQERDQLWNPTLVSSRRLPLLFGKNPPQWGGTEKMYKDGDNLFYRVTV